MGIKPSAVYDALRTLIDTIETNPDPAVRLAAYLYLGEKYTELVPRARDAAVYEARKKYAVADLCEVAGCSKNEVYEWTANHVRRTGAPMIGRNHRVNLDRVIDLTKDLGVYRRG